MKAYVVVDIAVHNMDLYKEYTSRSPAFVEKHQGKYIVRGGAVAVSEGEWSPQRFVIIEFPSRKNADAFVNDAEYQLLAEKRRAATSSNLIVVDGV